MAAASELFYKEGVTAVGIERVLEHAGVAKATLYSAFGSKEGLVRAYLRARHAATHASLKTMASVASAEKIGTLITDAHAPTQELVELEAIGVEIVLAPGPAQRSADRRVKAPRARARRL